MLLLTSLALFAGLIAVVALVVVLCLVFAVVMYRKAAGAKQILDADVVKKELHRRETDVVIRIVREKPEEKAREALLNELRRIKSAELLVEEIIKSEKAERGIPEHHEVHHGDDNKGEKKAHGAGKPAPEAPKEEKAAQPAPKSGEKPAEQ